MSDENEGIDPKEVVLNRLYEIHDFCIDLWEFYEFKMENTQSAPLKEAVKDSILEIESTVCSGLAMTIDDTDFWNSQMKMLNNEVDLRFATRLIEMIADDEVRMKLQEDICIGDVGFFDFQVYTNLVQSVEEMQQMDDNPIKYFASKDNVIKVAVSDYEGDVRFFAFDSEE